MGRPSVLSPGCAPSRLPPGLADCEAGGNGEGPVGGPVSARPVCRVRRADRALSVVASDQVRGETTPDDFDIVPGRPVSASVQSVAYRQQLCPIVGELRI